MMAAVKIDAKKRKVANQKVNPQAHPSASNIMGAKKGRFSTKPRSGGPRVMKTVCCSSTR